MPYAIVRGNINPVLRNDAPWRVSVSGLKAADLDELNRFHCSGVLDPFTVEFRQHPCVLLTALEVLGYRVVSSCPAPSSLLFESPSASSKATASPVTSSTSSLAAAQRHHSLTRLNSLGSDAGGSTASSSPDAVKTEFYTWTLWKDFPEPEPSPTPSPSSFARDSRRSPSSLRLNGGGHRSSSSSSDSEDVVTVKSDIPVVKNLNGDVKPSERLQVNNSSINGNCASPKQQPQKPHIAEKPPHFEQSIVADRQPENLNCQQKVVVAHNGSSSSTTSVKKVVESINRNGGLSSTESINESVTKIEHQQQHESIATKTNGESNAIDSHGRETKTNGESNAVDSHGRETVANHASNSSSVDDLQAAIDVAAVNLSQVVLEEEDEESAEEEEETSEGDTGSSSSSEESASSGSC